MRLIFELICLSVLVLIEVFVNIKRKRELASLNSYLTKVLSGDDVPDISDQREGEFSILKNNIYKATTALKYQKKLLSEDKTRMGIAMADISHQLKTPLASLMVMNDLLKKEEDSDKRREFLHTQSKQLDRMNWLVQTLLKLSKLDSNTADVKCENVSAKELLTGAIRPFEIQMDVQNIQLEMKESSLHINCDKNWTTEALSNIIKNCIEHMPNGGRLSIEVIETNIYYEIVINDTGEGIETEDLSHIFERFYKGKNAGKSSVGIGLALSKSIMEAQHGDILVKSIPGLGTEFDIRFYKTLI